MVEYGILGPLVASVDGTEAVLGGARTRAVLAVLLLGRGSVVSVDRLLDAVWGEDPPPTAETALQGHVSRLRRALGSDAIETRPPGYVLRSGPDAVDADRFESVVASVSGLPPRAAAARLREALALFRGPVLADLAFEPFAEVEIARLEERRLTATEARIEADLDAGDHDTVIAELEALVAEHPYRERLHAQRMLALYRAGRQADALAAYRAARKALDDGLGIDPGPELQALELRILQQDPGLAAPGQDARAGNLPVPATGLIGRDDDLAAVLAHLDGPARVVTLTGPGGTGKTRLAIEAALGAQERFPDGAWFVDLAPTTTATQAIGAIQTAFDLADVAGDDPLAPLRAHLDGRTLLLVLDNVEQVLDVAGPIATLVAQTPGLRVLATSRAPLLIAGEREVALEPLPAGPPGTPVDPDDPPPAIALFAERARLVAPGFVLTADNAADVAALCRRLDGLPLAIELAAARVRLLSPAAIMERIRRGPEVLRSNRRDQPERQRSLEAAIAWSHDLLDDGARRAFRRASLFVGGFGLGAFETVCCEPGDDGLELLEGLVEHSLIRHADAPVTTDDDGAAREGAAGVEPRFMLLETIRQFAAARLDAVDDEARVRHANWCRTVAEPLATAVGGPREMEAISAIRAEHDNIRAALDWLARTGRRDEQLALSAAVAPFWVRESHYREGRDRLSAALAPPSAGTERDRAIALRQVATIESTLGNGRVALERAQESVAAWEGVGDRVGLADALRITAMAAADLNELDIAREAAGRALAEATAAGEDRVVRGARHELAYLAALAGDNEETLRLLTVNAAAMRAAGDVVGLSATLSNLAETYRELGRLEEAEAVSREALEQLVRQGDEATTASGLATLAEVLLALGRVDEAALAAEDAVRRLRRTGGIRELPPILDALGACRLRSGEPARAVTLFAAATRLRETGAPGLSSDDLAAMLDGARVALGELAYEAAWTAGHDGPLDSVLSGAD